MTPAASDRRWLTLAIVGAAFFMTILDVAIVNVAIPSIQIDLHINEQTVQWVITAYAITFGGFLLLGGRMADLLGRKLDLPGRPGALHGRLARLRLRQQLGRADQRPRSPRPRRSDHLAGSAVDRDHDIPRGGRAEQGARDLGRARRLGRRGGRSLRRDPDEVPRLGVDLLGQRAGRHSRVRARRGSRAREQGRSGTPPLRRGRRGHGHRRPGTARLRDLQGARRGLGIGQDDPAADRSRSRSSACSR